MKHISKWTRRDYFRGLILFYLFFFICFIVLGYISGGTNKDFLQNLMDVAVAAIIIEIILIIYFLPSLIAKFKRKRNSTAIFVLNLLSGGGFIGFITAFCNVDKYNLYEYKSHFLFTICFMGGVWVASLIWALCNENKQS